MENEFDDAVDGVNKTRTKSDTPVAETFYESREYPVCPPGVYTAMIAKSELKMSETKFDEGPTEKIHLRLEILRDPTGKPVEYIGDDEKPHRYMVFHKPLTKSYGDGKKNGKPSNLYTLFKTLTGCPPLTEEAIVEKEFHGGVKKKGKVIRFDPKLFEYMECQVVIVAKDYTSRLTGEKKVGADIASVICNEQQRRKNLEQLPDHPFKRQAMAALGGASRTEPAATAGDVAEVFTGAGEPSAPAAEPQLPTVPPMTAALGNANDAKTREEAAARGFPIA